MFEGFFQKKYKEVQVFYTLYELYLIHSQVLLFFPFQLYRSNQTSKNCGFNSVISGLGLVCLLFGTRAVLCLSASRRHEVSSELH